MEKPALAARALPNTDLVDASISSECKAPLLKLQARNLTRRCAISFAMASVLAPLLHGEVAR
jgi:hypothetical protein